MNSFTFNPSSRTMFLSAGACLVGAVAFPVLSPVLVMAAASCAAIAIAIFLVSNSPAGSELGGDLRPRVYREPSSLSAGVVHQVFHRVDPTHGSVRDPFNENLQSNVPVAGSTWGGPAARPTPSGVPTAPHRSGVMKGSVRDPFNENLQSNVPVAGSTWGGPAARPTPSGVPTAPHRSGVMKGSVKNPFNQNVQSNVPVAGSFWGGPAARPTPSGVPTASHRSGPMQGSTRNQVGSENLQANIGRDDPLVGSVRVQQDRAAGSGWQRP